MCSDRVGSGHRPGWARRLGGFAVLTGVVSLGLLAPAHAGGPFDRRGSLPVPTSGVVSAQGAVTVNSHGRLGTFYPTPYIMVRGNAPAGGGYSPLNQDGDTTLSLYGPLSSFRMTSAPVLTYSRGYDGRTVIAPGTSFSAPNYPRLTPVVNPTQASYYYGFRRSGTPPWWASGINWIDQN
jgi:hypothetical protein